MTVQSKAHQPFSSSDDAALAAFDEINPASIAQNVEFAGRIFRNPKTGKYSFTRANRGLRDDSNAGPKIHGMTNIGTYHTHAGNFDITDEEFSSTDLLKAVMGNEVAYLATPRKRVLKFIPARLLDDPTNADPSINGSIEVLRSVFVLKEITIEGDPSARC